MRRIILFSVIGLVFLLADAVIAGTIYTWTDADGVRRYSNSQPPEDARNVQTINELHNDQAGGDQVRQEEYDRMVEDAGQRADQQFEEAAEKKAQEAAAEKQQQLDEQAQRVDKERARLQKEIADLEGRALGPTFSAGMRANLIKQVQEKINRLESDPEGYFNRTPAENDQGY